MTSAGRWYGELPSGWIESRVGWLADLINGYPFNSELFGDEGYPLVRIRDIGSSESEVHYSGDFAEAAAINPGDVLIGMDGDFSVGRWKGPLPALLNQRVCLLRGDDYVTRYLEYALPMPLKRINDLTYATTVKHLSSGQVYRTWMPVPEDKNHLQLIVDFLDRETAQIDRMVSGQERLAALLEERRIAAIQQAATIGIRDGELVESAYPDLGRIPRDWTPTQVKRVAVAAAGGTPDTENRVFWAEEGEDGIPWVAIGDMSRRERVKETTKAVTVAGVADKRLKIGSPGTVLFAMYASVGEVSILDIPACWNQAILGLSPRPGGVTSKFLYYALQTVRDRLPTLYRSNTQHNINAEQVGNLRLAVPPLSVQKEIVSYLDEVTSGTDEMIKKAEESIALMKERRAAVISAAVTGRLDVRTGVERVERELEEARV